MVTILRKDLAVLRGAPCWRRTMILLSYVQAGATLCVDVDLLLVDHASLNDFVLINLMALGGAMAVAIVGRGFRPVPKPEMIDVLSPTAEEDRITAERAA